MSVPVQRTVVGVVAVELSDADYQRLLTFRTQLRRFDQWSTRRAMASGLTHAQHQLLLAIRGHADSRGPTIGEVAEYLLVRHHTAVELANRTQELGFISRSRNDADRRVVRLVLTAKGRRRIRSLSAAHMEELRQLAPILSALVADGGRARHSRRSKMA
jgi:DNA-binding MarR family transcriptional regulator